MQIQVVGEMQQRVCSRSTSLFTENGHECGAPADPELPFRCSRCGEHERFRSLSSLRAHLEYSHNYYHTMHELRLPTSRGHSHPERVLHVRSLSDTRGVNSCMERCRRHSVGTQAAEKMQTEDDEEEGASEDDLKFRKCSPVKTNIPLPLPLDNPTEPGSETEVVSQKWSICAGEVSVRRRLTNVLRAADSTMQRRLHRISRELAQTDTELQCERAHSQHLAQERQEVHERERALSRQVDMAVMVIATLKEQLNNSENELERREQEVITIQNFLEAAAQHEICGKVRIQHFIENLLKRIALAERLLEYYQISPSPPNYNDYMQQTAENGSHRITKSRSAGFQLSQSCPQEGRKYHSQLGRAFPNAPRERMGASGCFRPDRRDEVWTQRQRSAGFED
ncbi:protein ZNF365 isoform X2 [Esox lucius]|uniref:FBX41/ZN365 C2H2-type zinc finger domain-containing protein n=1 Tax=Esox lucius TaxID=8010 RepID=A0A3P8XHL6_ESOLU|nr:protein ZNF365 isoform X2 [Esox lucius]